MLVAPGSQFSSRPALAGLPRPTPRPVVTHPRASWTSTTRLVRVPRPRLHIRPPSPRRRRPQFPQPAVGSYVPLRRGAGAASTPCSGRMATWIAPNSGSPRAWASAPGSGDGTRPQPTLPTIMR